MHKWCVRNANAKEEYIKHADETQKKCKRNTLQKWIRIPYAMNSQVHRKFITRLVEKTLTWPCKCKKGFGKIRWPDMLGHSIPPQYFYVKPTCMHNLNMSSHLIELLDKLVTLFVAKSHLENKSPCCLWRSLGMSRHRGSLTICRQSNFWKPYGISSGDTSFWTCLLHFTCFWKFKPVWTMCQLKTTSDEIQRSQIVM